MYFKNENDNKANSPQHNHQQQPNHHHMPTATSTSSSTSSNDSGVIIIDNRTIIGNNKTNNSNNKSQLIAQQQQQQQYNNINNNIISHSNNKLNTHKNATNALRVELPNEKIDNTTKAATALTDDNGKIKNNNQNQKCNQNDECNNSQKSNSNRPKSINIENIINITKGVDDGNSNSNGHCNAEGQQHCLPNGECCNHHRNDDDCYADKGFGDSDASPKIISTSPMLKHSPHSPTLSIRSTSISIVSIDENAIDSSIIDSDSDREADAEGVHTNYVVKKLGQQTTYPAGSTELPNINKGLTVISQQIHPNSLTPMPPEHILNGGFLSAPPPLQQQQPLSAKLSNASLTPTALPQIGSIALTNSTDVTFGDKHFYEGPVTIQQILIDRRDKWKNNDGNDGGHDNPMFAKESDYDASGSKANQKSPSEHETPYSFICKRKAIILTTAIIVLTVLIGVIVLTTTRLPKSKQPYGVGEDYRKNIPINSTIGIEDEEEYNTLLVMGRKDWMAREPKSETDKLNMPVHRVIVSHTASEPCMDQETCSQRVRDIQNFHMDSNDWDDIGYNFLIGGDGYVYSARGWYKQGAHTKGYNTDSIGVAFIGTFTTVKPTRKQIAAAELLIEEGIRLQTIAPNFCVYGARQLGATESPGHALYKIIQSWPHWSPNIDCRR